MIEMGRGGIEPFNITHFTDSNLQHFRNSVGTECVTLLESHVFSQDDQQDLRTIISLWPGLAPETKVEVMQVIEAARQTQQPALKCLL